MQGILYYKEEILQKETLKTYAGNPFLRRTEQFRISIPKSQSNISKADILKGFFSCVGTQTSLKAQYEFFRDFF